MEGSGSSSRELDFEILDFELRIIPTRSVSSLRKRKCKIQNSKRTSFPPGGAWGEIAGQGEYHRRGLRAGRLGKTKSIFWPRLC
jgi:hypothetical protein